MDQERILAAARFRATSFGVVSAGAPWGVRAPAIDYAVIYGILDGTMCFDGAGAALALQPGDIIFLPHGAQHRLASDRDVNDFDQLIDLLRRKPGEYIFHHGGAGPANRFIAGGSLWDADARASVARLLPDMLLLRREAIPENSHIVEILHMVEKEAGSPRVQSGVIVNGLFNILLSEILGPLLDEALSQSASGAALPARIIRSLMLIHGAAPGDWSAGDLAERVGLSRAAFSSQFRLATGRAPGAYVKRMRLERSASFLTSGDISVADAAERAGYHSTPSFSKAFKAEFGLSPDAWRRQAKRNAPPGEKL